MKIALKSTIDTRTLTVEQFSQLESKLQKLGIRYTYECIASLLPSTVSLKLSTGSPSFLELHDESSQSSNSQGNQASRGSVSRRTTGAFSPTRSVVPTEAAGDGGKDPTTSGLSLGSYQLDSASGTIRVEINGRSYVYKPVEGVDIYDLYRSLRGIAKYSLGRSLAYLKKNAVGVRVDEDVTKKTYDDYGALLIDLQELYPTAQTVTDDNRGVELYIDPATKKQVGSWVATQGRGTLIVTEASTADGGDVIDDLETWLADLDDDAEVITVNSDGATAFTASDKSGKQLGTFVQSGDKGQGRLKA